MQHAITIRHGALCMIYHDDLRALDGLGNVSIRRASHVEPVPGPAVAWHADMAPSGGPVLGPFPTHAAALAAERTWLQVYRL